MDLVEQAGHFLHLVYDDEAFLVLVSFPEQRRPRRVVGEGVGLEKIDEGGGLDARADSGVGNSVAFSNTIDEERTLTFFNFFFLKAQIAASNVDAAMRSFAASKSYASS